MQLMNEIYLHYATIQKYNRHCKYGDNVYPAELNVTII